MMKMASSGSHCGNSVDITTDFSSRTEETPSIPTQENSLMLDYETQFFGFTPKSFSDGMYNAVLEFTWDCLDGARQYIIQQFPDIVSKEEADKAADDIIEKLTAAIDKAFDKFEAYILTNVFIIPKHILLPEDAVHRGVSYTEQDETRIDTEIQSLEDKIKAAKYMNACMRQELEDIARVQTAYDQFLSLQKRMEKVCVDCGVPDLKEALVCTSEKARRIQEILERTRNFAPTLTNSIKLSS